MNFRNFKTVVEGKVRWIAPKKHSGIYPCDMEISSSGGKMILRQTRCTKTHITYKIMEVTRHYGKKSR